MLLVNARIEELDKLDELDSPREVPIRRCGIGTATHHSLSLCTFVPDHHAPNAHAIAPRRAWVSRTETCGRPGVSSAAYT